MNVFCDFHHSGLAYAMHLLIEKRLGWNLYFPIGVEWFDKGYWAIAEPYGNNRDTVNQYLALDERYVPKDGTPVLNDIASEKAHHYEIYDHAHGYTHKSLTFTQFQSINIDIIIGSIPRHWDLYRKLRDIYKPQARVVAHMGNMFDEVEYYMRSGIIRNLMASTITFPYPDHINTVFYHQEIDTHVFHYTPYITELIPRITSFVNLLPARHIYEAYKTAMPDFEFRAYGSSTPEGPIQTIQEIASHMKDSMWGFHLKPRGDGFGHILYDWAFIGRPIITRFSDYADKLGGELLEDGITAIDLEKRSFPDTIDYIRHLSHPTHYSTLATAIQSRVSNIIDYDREALQLKRFFTTLL